MNEEKLQEGVQENTSETVQETAPVTVNEKTKKPKSGIVLMIAGILLIMAAVALVLYNRIQDAGAANEAALILSQLERATSFSELQSEDNNMPVISIDGIDYIGQLLIECEGKDPVELPVMSDWDDVYSWSSPGRYAGSAYNDSMVLCGHNMPSHFQILMNMKPGDKVTFTDVNGNVFRYEVMQLYNLKPTQVAEMITGDWDLTLFTCTYAGNERVTVRCERI